MKSQLINKIIIGVVGLTLASAPLAAAAANWDGGNQDRGGYQTSDNRGDRDRGGYQQRGDRDNRDDGARYDHRTYNNGYFGPAPGGFNGYFFNGGWYQHRRLTGGIWIYF